MLGAHLIVKLLQEGEHVRATYRNEKSQNLTRKILSYYLTDVHAAWQNIEWVQLDLLDVSALGDALLGIDEVYHCAALVSFDPKDAQRLLDENTEVTANVVNCCLANKIGKLAHVSSVAALGRKPGVDSINENNEWVESKHNSAYAKSKYLSELEVWRGIEEGLNAVIVNPSIIMGAGDWGAGSAALFGRVASGFKFYTNGVNGYVDARDVANVLFQLMKSDISAERFVLAAENKSYREVFWAIADSLKTKKASIEAKPWMGEIVWRLEVARSRIFGGTPLVTRDTARTSHQHNYYSSDKVKKQLNYSFRDLERTIADMAQLYQKENS